MSTKEVPVKWPAVSKIVLLSKVCNPKIQTPVLVCHKAKLNADIMNVLEIVMDHVIIEKTCIKHELWKHYTTIKRKTKNVGDHKQNHYIG